MADIRLNIESGEKEIELVNEKRGLSVTIVVAAYDVFFLGRILEAAEKLDKLNGELSAAAPPETAGAERFMEFYRKSKEIDEKMRSIIDDLFDTEVCNAIFPKQSLFAVGEGAPTWANILYGVIDELDDGLGAEKEKAQARIRKYSAKYKR